MIKKLTYKKRLKLILIIAGLFAFIIYKLSISDTLDLLEKKNNIKKQIAENIDAPNQIKKLKLKLRKIENVVGNGVDTNTNVHQLLLESITEYTQENNLILKEFPKPYTSVDNGYITETSVVTIEGGFIPLLKLSNYIENNYQGGKVVALNFKTIKELRTRKLKLISTIYLQNVKPTSDENNT